jgi:hypothetical protein
LDESDRAPRADGCDLLVGDPSFAARQPRRRSDSGPSTQRRRRPRRPTALGHPNDEVLRRVDALTPHRVIERLEKIPEQAYASVTADLLGR